MNKSKIEYIVVVIGEFARRHNITYPEAFNYVNHFNGMRVIDTGYEIEHTFSIEDAVTDLTNYCRRFGGTL